ncbi:hypothetical protein E4U34_005440 [Claviceps purpurea]|nr:hypothetical protein E4U34_005440 [Claviceps purpurea]
MTAEKDTAIPLQVNMTIYLWSNYGWKYLKSEEQTRGQNERLLGKKPDVFAVTCTIDQSPFCKNCRNTTESLLKKKAIDAMQRYHPWSMKASAVNTPIESQS